MTDEERVGQIFMPSISPLSGNGTQEMTPELQSMLKKIHPGGVILFARDLSSVEQVVRLIDALQNESPTLEQGDKIPLFISIDQEGGYLTRLPFGPRMPGNMALGASRSAVTTRRVAKTIGDEISSLGINMNFAPVLDVETNQNNPVIGIRSFGSDPNLVTELGDAYIAGMHDAGIICSGKHFPGHGDVDIDSHLGLPLENHSKARMNEIELVPFKSAIASGVDTIMTAHIIFPAYDNSTNLLDDGTEVATPATLSKSILTGLLREELSFDGLIITDAMMMKAIVDNFKTGDAAVRAVRAGADIILYPDPVDEAYEAVLTAYQTDQEMRARVDESVRRILAMKEKYGIIDPLVSEKNPISDMASRIAHAQEICLGEEAYAVEREASEQTVTLLSDRSNRIPFSCSEMKSIAIFTPTMLFTNETSLAVEEKCNGQGYSPEIFAYTYQNETELSEEQQQSVMNASLVILGTSSSNATQRTNEYYIPQFSRDLLDFANDYEIPVAGFALNQPYDIIFMQDVPIYVATYAGRTGGQNIHSAIRALFGEIPITGTLPVNIEDENGTVIFPMNSGIIR
ncbi:glycoside hydrolase family 3 protein [Methanospirillum hungatei]|uniref:glycoside hydrolase family 3 protein n=1 Tax=Methanospirillum hungatei TaxID=2203 RepID=UPI0026EA8DE3|nr:glycoside hydrolase family 3 protein [Methanospirillum hungatei]MCA1916812.1 glycoside hydrolase family 3 protein [Methanospirillum hungatei]